MDYLLPRDLLGAQVGRFDALICLRPYLDVTGWPPQPSRLGFGAFAIVKVNALVDIGHRNLDSSFRNYPAASRECSGEYFLVDDVIPDWAAIKDGKDILRRDARHSGHSLVCHAGHVR
jgi:hypothetical protein